MIKLTKAQKEAIAILRDAQFDTDQGMPQELFLLVSGLVPLPNVDLLIVDEQNRILLSRRNDRYFEKSWHIPGGCMHINESFDRCISQTAHRELGIDIAYDPKPIAVRNVIRGRNEDLRYPRERTHNVAILFRCTPPPDWGIDNANLTEDDNGYLKWFDTLPEDFMKIQYAYSDILHPWNKKEKEHEYLEE